MNFDIELDPVIAIVGLGYVGLPLAAEFGKRYQVVGFDIDQNRIESILDGKDITLEISDNDLRAITRMNTVGPGVYFTSDSKFLAESNVKIITVPTPVDQYNNPNLFNLSSATKTVAQSLKKNDIVIYESTVFPGCTEEICVPILEEVSGLRFNIDFFCGYSPERINPGDKTRTLPNIKKITSGSTLESANLINKLYLSIIPAGTFLTRSIKIAEAAKVIENAQRDINIAFVNELSKIFCLLDLDTHEVLEAASTKWNFLNFAPGLVGGHCIGVDPYYLAQKAAAVGYYPEIILSGRRINDSMGAYVAGSVIRLMIKKGINVLNAQILVLGLTFKENCPDIRNTKVLDVIQELQNYGALTTTYDPWVDPAGVNSLYQINCSLEFPTDLKYDAIVLAVAHRQFLDMDFSPMLNDPGVLYDVKGVLALTKVDGRL